MIKSDITYYNGTKQAKCNVSEKQFHFGRSATLVNEGIRVFLFFSPTSCCQMAPGAWWWKVHKRDRESGLKHYKAN